MRTPVLPLVEYINFLKVKQDKLKQEIEQLSTPDDVKRKTSEAVVASKGKRIIAFKEVIDIITEQAYYKGRLEEINDLLSTAEESLRKYQEATNNGN